jgi:hypothetical protein
VTTFAGRLRLAAGREVSYSGQAPARPSGLRAGWCPPNSNTADLAPMQQRYPGTSYKRLYSKTGLVPWTSGILAMAYAETPMTLLHFSFKTWPVPFADWLDDRPPGLPPFVVTLDHEPEQDPGGSDPTPEQFRQEWRELLAAIAAHRRGGEVIACPTYTEYAATKGEHAATWEQDYGVVSGYDGVGAVGFDVYDTGYPAYRKASAYDFPLRHARKYRRRLLIPERGIGRKGTDDGSAVARAMREECAFLARQPEAWGWGWFYRGGQNLDERGPERQALTDLIAQYGG